MLLALAFAFVAGALTVLAPCTLPVLPLVLGAGSGGTPRRPLGIVVGFGATFVLVAVLLASILGASGLTTSQLRLGSSLVLAFLGAAVAVPVLGRAAARRLAPLAGRIPAIAARGDGLLAGFGMGVMIGLVWAPCVGPIMAAALAVAASSGPTPSVLATAVAYVLGAAVPMIAVAAVGRRALAVAGGPARRARVQQVFGALMVVTSLAVVTGYDVPIENAVSSVVPNESLTSIGEVAATVMPGSTVAADASGLPAPLASELPGRVALDDLGPAPDLTGITAWINSAPLTLAALRGRVVLVHFWTFDCINCLHVQPYVKAWYDRYAPAGLVVIGVHTPELSFERDLGNVRNAVVADGVTFPVAFDPAYATWNAYANQYWPAIYFVDKTGRIRHVHAGEGDYAVSEQVIRELLALPG